MPSYYASTSGGGAAVQATFASVDATHLYVWGLHYDGDAISIDDADSRLESIDVLDLATETWSSRPIPDALAAGFGGDVAFAGTRLFRFDQTLSVLDLDTGSWRCVPSDEASWVNARVFTDGTTLYTVQIDIVAAINQYRVRAYTLP